MGYVIGTMKIKEEDKNAGVLIEVVAFPYGDGRFMLPVNCKNGMLILTIKREQDNMICINRSCEELLEDLASMQEERMSLQTKEDLLS